MKCWFYFLVAFFLSTRKISLKNRNKHVYSWTSGPFLRGAVTATTCIAVPRLAPRGKCFHREGLTRFQQHKLISMSGRTSTIISLRGGDVALFHELWHQIKCVEKKCVAPTTPIGLSRGQIRSIAHLNGVIINQFITAKQCSPFSGCRWKPRWFTGNN